MSQITTGIRAILSHPVVYNLFQHLMGAERLNRALVERHVRPFAGMRILDLGCGTADILAVLPGEVAYVGYDMSAEYIAAAQAKFGARGHFHCRLLSQTEASELEKFDLVMGTGVLHHLSNEEASDFMVLAKSALKPNGRVLTRDPCFATGQNPLARFLIARDRGQHVRQQPGYEAIARPHFAHVEGWLTHQSWIPYTHWTMECRA